MSFKKIKPLNSFQLQDSANWNVAGFFAPIKIMRYLYLADEYEIIATFGTSDLLEEFMMNEDMKTQAKIKAIKRLAKTIEIVIRNTIFAIIDKNDKNLMFQYKEDIMRIQKVINNVEIKRYDQSSKKTIIEINTEHFNKILEMLCELKEKINEPLNRSNLIFTHTDNLEPDELKKRIMEQMINSG